MRKYWTILLVILLVGANIFGYLWFRSRTLSGADPRKAIPLKTIAFLETNNISELFRKITDENIIWKDIKGIENLEGIDHKITHIDSLFRKNERFRELFGGRYIVSLTMTSGKKPGIIIASPAVIRNEDELIIETFNRYTVAEHSNRRFNSGTIHDVSWQENGMTKKLSFSVFRGIVICSFTAELVEDAILTILSEKYIFNSEEFENVSRTISGEAFANIYINYRNLPGWIAHISGNNIDGKRIGEIAEWGALDADIFLDHVILNGFTSVKDSAFQELSIFQGQEPVEFSSPSILPAGTIFFKIHGFSDKELYFQGLNSEYQSDTSSRRYREKAIKVFDTYGIDLQSGIKDIIENEYGTAFMSLHTRQDEFFFLRVRSQGIAEDLFKSWVNSYSSKKKLPQTRFILNATLDNTTGFPVYSLPLGGIPSMVFGSSFDAVNKDYFAFINNFIVFSNSFESLKQFIYQVRLGNTLSTGNSQNEFISSLSNYYIYLKPYPALRLIEKRLNPGLAKVVRSSENQLSKFDLITIQFSATGKLLYNNIFVNFSGENTDYVNTSWRSRMDTAIVMKPSILINHTNNQKEILVQDLKDQIYLLSKEGLILWKQKIDGQILGEIRQLDYFGNGKLQYIFNTENSIYMIDRNGNMVEKYPVRLRSKATAGISIFDYDNNGVMRICIPGEDRNIYMYELSGNVVPGWKPEKTDNIVDRPVQHFRIGKNDYIVAIDKFRFYIYDRRGSIRLRPEKYFPVSQNNQFYIDNQPGKSNPGLISTDTAGNIMKVYTNRKVEKLVSQKLDPAHFFIPADLNGDKRIEYLIASGSEFFITDERGNKGISVNMPEKISIKPGVFNFAATDNKIGLVLPLEGNIYIYNNDGSLYNGFPLEGSTMFSITNFGEAKGRFNLIMGSKDNFLYNYIVQ